MMETLLLLTQHPHEYPGQRQERPGGEGHRERPAPTLRSAEPVGRRRHDENRKDEYHRHPGSMAAVELAHRHLCLQTRVVYRDPTVRTEPCILHILPERFERYTSQVMEMLAVPGRT